MENKDLSAIFTEFSDSSVVVHDVLGHPLVMSCKLHIIRCNKKCTLA